MRKDVCRNHYGDLITAEKVRLIADPARRLGLPRHALEDAQQEVAIAAWGLRSDTAGTRSSQPTALAMTAIDNQIRMMHRDETRRRRREEKYRLLSGVPSEAGDGEAVAAPEDKTGLLASDVHMALATLSPIQRAVCEELSRGCTESLVARHLGYSRITVRRLVAEIRRQLGAMGLHQWLRC
jgi:DNA-directed RNA polymerase specialized sigma24 family protein